MQVPRSTRDAHPALIALAILGGAILGAAVFVTAFTLAANALDVVAWLAGGLLALVPSADPVYTRAALGTLANVGVDGVQVRGAMGALPHAVDPALFSEV